MSIYMYICMYVLRSKEHNEFKFTMQMNNNNNNNSNENNNISSNKNKNNSVTRIATEIEAVEQYKLSKFFSSV